MRKLDLEENVISDLAKKNIFPEFIKKIRYGCNSSTFCIIDRNDKFLLKFYRNEKFNRIRLKRELIFLEFLNSFSFKNTPNLITYNEEYNWILMSWINGAKIKNVNKKIVEKLLFFLSDIQKFKNKKLSNKFINAAEACFSLQDHFLLIKKRMQKIEKIFDSEESLSCKQNNAMLNLYRKIDEKYLLSLNMAKDKFSHDSYKAIIKLDYRIISPSDIGFHNCLLLNNELYFIDFEYAGWDDPLKLICDLVLQPDYSIPKVYLGLIRNLINKLNLVPDWQLRLEIMLEIYTIKWVCIILNPLLTRNLDEDKSIDPEFYIDKASNYLKRTLENISIAKSELCNY